MSAVWQVLRRSTKIFLISGLLVAAAAVYYFVDPMTVWTPKCPIKLLTGFSCPACGAQRAAHALMHLHIGEAIGYNLFLIIGVPYLLSAAVVEIAGRERFPAFAKIVCSKALAYSYAVLFFVWWVVRNILDI